MVDVVDEQKPQPDQRCRERKEDVDPDDGVFVGDVGYGQVIKCRVGPKVVNGMIELVGKDFCACRLVFGQGSEFVGEVCVVQ